MRLARLLPLSRALPLAALAALTLAGCSGDGGTPSATPTSSAAPTFSYTVSASPDASPIATARASEGPRRRLLGEVSAEGAVSFGPVLESDRPDPHFSNDMGFVLHLYDASNKFIGTAIPEVGIAWYDVGLEGDETSAGGAFFAADFKYEGVARIELLFNGKVLGSTTASAHAPTVTITSPASGAAVTGDAVTLEWEGEDADGDALEYDVVYTTDGLSWVTLTRERREQSLTFDRSEISGSASGVIRVVVNDGFLSAYDDVAELAVAGHPPTMVITSPDDGAKYATNVPLIFDAHASDPEDGTLPDSGVTWSSNVDGVLDTSGDDYLRGRDLTLGFHTVTASVTDSDGNTTHATATIEIVAAEFDDQGLDGNGGTTANSRGGSSTPTPTPSPSSNPSPSLTPLASATPSATPSSDGATATDGVEASGRGDGFVAWWWATLGIATILGFGVIAWRLWVRMVD